MYFLLKVVISAVALGVACASMAAGYSAYVWILRRVGIEV